MNDEINVGLPALKIKNRNIKNNTNDNNFNLE
jgi:hypothetical protein